ncbi:MAG: cell division protein ZapA [Polaromonas sp. 39-63-203]|jgi:cell division protein ZapA|uniref:cell division protein ZapA n=1 Tax=Polaromonas sp. TaxID=1869339 RepID=UPI000BD69E7C|nr:cell division protein ZapA [Polaromonas sp.]OYY52533.1 MAG: cell division protein ZapA [Polaromonas sp. 35-63-240]OYY99768.1 MAG: cell division protein ZapA [Polaromonas sp. 28-63-22]OYZ84849.1 MAG: cell division protein ZapA [Polaromonas sp. 24-62-144]OZB01216.1 MAG: cell division protein ZapA [Polaromonas sp. 39-63-203]HQS32573.1 cell division protein ZapA [Polaromonas sp.]
MKQLEVQIMGQSYLLGCPENGDARMLDAVNRVDIAMCKIRDAGKIKARDRIAVLAALNLAFELPERPSASSAESPTSTAAAAAGRTEPGQTPLSAAEPHVQAQLAALLQRLDAALGVDGRLL